MTRWKDYDEDPYPKEKTESDFKKEGFNIEAKVLIHQHDKDVMVILHPNGVAYKLRVD